MVSLAFLLCCLFSFQNLQTSRPCQIVTTPITEASTPNIILGIVSGDTEVEEEGEAAAGAELGDMDMMQAE